jgi:hypothetical protein
MELPNMTLKTLFPPGLCNQSIHLILAHIAMILDVQDLTCETLKSVTADRPE